IGQKQHPFVGIGPEVGTQAREERLFIVRDPSRQIHTADVLNAVTYVIHRRKHHPFWRIRPSDGTAAENNNTESIDWTQLLQHTDYSILHHILSPFIHTSRSIQDKHKIARDGISIAGINRMP